MELVDVLKFISPSSIEVKMALLSKFSPLQPGVMKQNWRNNKKFGYDSPSTSEFWDLFQKYDFRCSICSSQYRISVDHINEDNTDHRLENLQILCSPCNVSKANDGLKNPDAQYVIMSEFMAYIKKYGEVPTTRQLAKHIKSKHEFRNRPLSGYLHLYRFLVFRYNNPFQSKQIEDCISITQQIIEILQISSDEAIRAIISTCTPPDHYTTRSNWRNSKRYGNNAPEGAVFLELLGEAGYKCEECSNISKLSFDHIDSDPTNHLKENLKVLCFTCNRKKSRKGIKFENKKAKIFDFMLDYFHNHRAIPPIKRVGEIFPGDTQSSLGGEFYFYKYLEKRFNDI